MDDVLLSLNETVSPWRGEALGHHQCERGVGVHAHIATLDVWADAWRHVTLEGFREVGQSGQTTEESWKRGEVGRGGGGGGRGSEGREHKYGQQSHTYLHSPWMWAALVSVSKLGCWSDGTLFEISVKLTQQ